MTQQRNAAAMRYEAQSAEGDSGPELRHLRSEDVASALELSLLAGWNQTEADWRRLLALSPDQCFCIAVQGRVLATATLVTFGSACAWVGMVLTHPNWRGRGFAGRLVARALSTARTLGVPTVKLDATSQGRSLYESLGFTPERNVERWERSGSAAGCSYTQSGSFVLDETAYGYSRRELLEALGADSTRRDEAGGYVLTRPGAIRCYLGPCIAQDPETASRLLTPVVNEASATAWFWDLPADNQNAGALASTLGFEPVRRLVRMRTGPALPEREQKIYALAGFEFG